jgi:hypothetical protein
VAPMGGVGMEGISKPFRSDSVVGPDSVHSVVDIQKRVAYVCIVGSRSAIS